MRRPFKIFISAGEKSGDQLAYDVITDLRRKIPNLKVAGMGGEDLKGLCPEFFFNYKNVNFFGVTDVVSNIFSIFKFQKDLCYSLSLFEPDLIILIDLPDFHLSLVRKIKSTAPIIYYVSPQVWVWRASRIKTIKRYVKKMLVLFPFEEELYLRARMPVAYVGHPLVKKYDTPSVLRPIQCLGILPGSRKSELVCHTPLLLETVKHIKKDFPQTQIWVSKVAHLPSSLYRPFEDLGCIVEEDLEKLLKHIGFAFVASGTVTLDVSLSETPFAIFYKVSALNFWLLRSVARYRGPIGLPNIILKEGIVPEFLQNEATSNALIRVYEEVIHSSVRYNSMLESLRRLKYFLKEKHRPESASKVIYEYIQKHC